MLVCILQDVTNNYETEILNPGTTQFKQNSGEILLVNHVFTSCAETPKCSNIEFQQEDVK